MISRSPRERPSSASTWVMPAESKVTLSYDVVADSAVESVPHWVPSASFSSRELAFRQGQHLRTTESRRAPDRSARSQAWPEQNRSHWWISRSRLSRRVLSGP